MSARKLTTEEAFHARQLTIRVFDVTSFMFCPKFPDPNFRVLKLRLARDHTVVHGVVGFTSDQLLTLQI